MTEISETTQKRDELLSVKVSVEEKARIVAVAKLYKMAYSDFLRQVALGACDNAGVGPADVADAVRERDKVKAVERRKSQERKAARAKEGIKQKEEMKIRGKALGRARSKFQRMEPEDHDPPGDVRAGDSVPEIAA